MFTSRRDDNLSKYIRERIRQARLESNETQEVLAKRLEKTRVAISDLERGRVSVNASDLGIIAAHYEKPISYFYPPRVKVGKDELSSLDEELIMAFWQLPDTQKQIAFEYIKQQLGIVNKARGKELQDMHAKIKSEK